VTDEFFYAQIMFVLSTYEICISFTCKKQKYNCKFSRFLTFDTVYTVAVRILDEISLHDFSAVIGYRFEIGGLLHLIQRIGKFRKNPEIYLKNSQKFV
jgi:hypothetical protein